MLQFWDVEIYGDSDVNVWQMAKCLQFYLVILNGLWHEKINIEALWPGTISVLTLMFWKSHKTKSNCWKQIYLKETQLVTDGVTSLFASLTSRLLPECGVITDQGAEAREAEQ